VIQSCFQSGGRVDSGKESIGRDSVTGESYQRMSMTLGTCVVCRL
jgi:hypothetical protein